MNKEELKSYIEESELLVFREIKETYTGNIYYGDFIHIGTFTNQMEVMDFRCQVARSQKSNYFFVLDEYPDKKIIINDDGTVNYHPKDMISLTNFTQKLYNCSLHYQEKKKEFLFINVPVIYKNFKIVKYGYAGTYLMETDSTGLNHWKLKIPDGDYEIVGFDDAEPNKNFKLLKL